jgi:hypothetical protein
LHFLCEGSTFGAASHPIDHPETKLQSCGLSEGSAQGLYNEPRRHYQPNAAFPLQLSYCMRF